MKTLAKIQLTAIFLVQDMRRNFLHKFIELCMERHDAETSAIEFLLQKRKSIPRETQKH